MNSTTTKPRAIRDQLFTIITPTTLARHLKHHDERTDQNILEFTPGLFKPPAKTTHTRLSSFDDKTEALIFILHSYTYDSPENEALLVATSGGAVMMTLVPSLTRFCDQDSEHKRRRFTQSQPHFHRANRAVQC